MKQFLSCHLEHDVDNDLAYLTINSDSHLDRTKTKIAKTVRVGEGILFDLDQHGHLVGIEFLEASKWLV